MTGLRSGPASRFPPGAAWAASAGRQLRALLPPVAPRRRGGGSSPPRRAPNGGRGGGPAPGPARSLSGPARPTRLEGRPMGAGDARRLGDPAQPEGSRAAAPQLSALALQFLGSQAPWPWRPQRPAWWPSLAGKQPRAAALLPPAPGEAWGPRVELWGGRAGRCHLRERKRRGGAPAAGPPRATLALAPSTDLGRLGKAPVAAWLCG